MFYKALLFVTLIIISFSGICQERSLDYFLQKGIINSPLLRDLNGQISSNLIDSLIIKAMNRPKVEFRGYAYYAPTINHLGYSEVLTNTANFTSVIGVSQQFLNKKTIEANLAKTRIQKQALSNTAILTGNNLKKAITAAYLDIYSTYSDISVNLELLSLAKEQEKILKALTENGIYKQTDYLSFAIDIQGQELAVSELRLQLRKQVSDLYILCGIQDSIMFDPIKPDLVNHSSYLKESLPMFIRFTIDSLRINNEYLLLDRNYKPVISWFSDAGLINNDPHVIYENFGLSLGLNFTLPIYDGNQFKLNQRKLKNEEEIRAGYSSAFKKEYDQQLQQWIEELSLTHTLIPAVRGQVDNARKLVDQEKELINRGAGSITDYLIAIKNYLFIRKNLTQYEVRLLQIQNEINYWK